MVDHRDASDTPCIYVLAGVNGAGKSSIAGAMFRQAGADYFNPDEAAKLILSENRGMDQESANSAAWRAGKRLLERAIDEKLHFAFETTLGGRTISALLAKALIDGLTVRVWYIGVEGPELHISRVRERMRRGGHSISESTIRHRYDSSRLNLIALLPNLTELRLYDNTAEANPYSGVPPKPLLLLHVMHRRIAYCRNLKRIPGWAKPIVAAALKISPAR